MFHAPDSGELPMGPTIARLAAYGALLFLCAALLTIVALIAETFGRIADAAEWAGAIGGFLAVAAAALIAIRQSVQAREMLNRQSTLHAEALARQEKLQSDMLAHQAKLQQEALAHQVQIDAEKSMEAHARAVASSKVIFDMTHTFVVNMNGVKIWNKPFHEVHNPVLLRASSILDAIPHSNFKTQQNILDFGKFCSAFSNVVRDFNDLCNADETDPQELSRFWVKNNFKSMRIALEKIDPDWSAGSLEAETPTAEEQKCYDEIYLKFYPELKKS